MPSAIFTGFGFSLESISKLTLNSIRVTFTNDPVAISSTGANDALNPNNYIISGPSENSINYIVQTSSVTNSVDIYLNNYLTNGIWTISCNNVHSLDGDSLSNPISLQLTVSDANKLVSTASGIQNDTSATIIRKNFSEGMGGPNWNALIAALGHSDDINLENSELAYNQLFKNSASGFYLDKLCADFGIIRPDDVNISDQNFSKLAIQISNNKLTIQSVLEILEIFYGSDATRAHAISGISNNIVTSGEPYALNDGDNLLINVNNINYNILFQSNNFQNIHAATAAEIANSINIQLNDNKSSAYATSKFNPDLNNNFVYIYSGSLGVGGAVQILGGKAQNSLQFGNNLNIDTSDEVTWDIAIYPNSSNPGQVRFTPTTPVDFSNIIVGDYINIFGTEFNSANRGTFTISNKNINWVEVTNFSGSAQSVTQVLDSDLVFYRPIKYTVQSQQNAAIAVQSKKAELDLFLPVTSTITSRDLHTAAYLQTPKIGTITNLQRDNSGIVTAISASHGLTSGQTILISGAIGSKFNGIYSVSSVIDSSTFQYKTVECKTVQNLAQNSCTFMASAASVGTYSGPYIFDPKNGVAISTISTTLTQVLAQNSAYRQISVSDSSLFPDGVGYLVFGFGTNSQVTPVRYIARPSNTTLLLDSTFNFPISLPSGSTITLLLQKGAYVPGNVNSIGACYITGSSAGRIEASSNIQSIVAGTIQLNETVLYPGDRGLGGEGFPTHSANKLSDIVYLYSSDDVDADIATDRED